MILSFASNQDMSQVTGIAFAIHNFQSGVYTAALQNPRHVMTIHPSLPKEEFRRLDRDMVEVSLLVPSWQVESVAQAAESEGVSVGEFIRRAMHEAVRRLIMPQGSRMQLA